jgi:hypothetical protein
MATMEVTKWGSNIVAAITKEARVLIEKWKRDMWCFKGDIQFHNFIECDSEILIGQVVVDGTSLIFRKKLVKENKILHWY